MRILQCEIFTYFLGAVFQNHNMGETTAPLTDPTLQTAAIPKTVSMLSCAALAPILPTSFKIPTAADDYKCVLTNSSRLDLVLIVYCIITRERVYSRSRGNKRAWLHMGGSNLRYSQSSANLSIVILSASTPEKAFFSKNIPVNRVHTRTL